MKGPDARNQAGFDSFQANCDPLVVVSGKIEGARYNLFSGRLDSSPPTPASIAGIGAVRWRGK
jgi:hypothetical protein